MASVANSKWFQYLICIAMLAVGVVGTYGFAREIVLHRAAVARSLPVEARILSHDLEETRSVEAGYSNAWMPVISYEYAIDGEIYLSDTVWPRPLFGDKGWAEGILAGFPIGTVQTAYYNPAQPGQSYLQTTKLSAANYGGLIIALLFLLFGSAKSIELLWKTFRT